MRWLAVSLLLWAEIGWAQLTIQGPQPTFNGQNVSSVDLIANPHRDVEPLRPLVLQKAGEPYAQDKVEKSIAALMGQFPTVQVSVIPEITGLRLNFLLEPAYYIGFISFPGAERFSYTRLLQAVNVADQEPFDRQRVPVAQQSLENFLRHNGYFQAVVDATYEIDAPHQIVNLTFTVKLGRQARIGTVSFEGADPAQDAQLTRSVKSLRARFTGGLLKSGSPYTPERIKSASALIRRTLARQHRLASKVRELPPTYHPETNRADVTFKTEIGPVVIVRISGARLTWIPFLAGREMKKAIPIFSEGTIDPDLVEEGRQNLIDHFQARGFFDVKVTPDFQKEPDKILLVYVIDRGKRHKVRGIFFAGNNSISEKDLLDQVTVKKARFLSHGSVSQKLLSQSERNIEALYRDRGFEEVKVKSESVNHNLTLDVTFQITEGTQTLVDNVQVTGNSNLSQNDLVAPVGFQLQSGKPFSPRRLVEDRNRISANYLNRGFLNVEVRATVNRDQDDPHRLNVLYAINEHQLVHIAQTVYLGEQHTRLSLIRQTANVPVESPMKRAELLGAESRLYDLNIFDWASVGPRKPIADQTDEDVLVRVHEAKRTDVIYGFGFEVARRGGSVPSGSVAVPGLPPVQLGKYQVATSQSTFASPQGSVEINRRNMRGLGETASASLRLARLDQRAVAAYAQPRFIGSQWGSLTSFSIERNSENPLFTAGQGDISFQVERLISRRTNTRVQFRYDFNKTYLSHLLVPQLVLPQDRNVRLSIFSATLIHDTRDKPLDAHHGEFGTLNFGVTPGLLGSSASFAKLFGQYAYYRPFRSIVFANSVRLGLAEAFGSSFVPTSQLFFSGGGTSLRGFPIDQAGPQRLVPFCNVLQGETGCVNISVPVGGNMLFILNSEVRFPLKIMKALGGVLFYDGGNVYSAINLNNFVSNYTNTIGLGLRYSTPIGPVRFDIGKNLNPVPGIGSVQYFITLGQAF